MNAAMFYPGEWSKKHMYDELVKYFTPSQMNVELAIVLDFDNDVHFNTIQSMNCKKAVIVFDEFKFKTVDRYIDMFDTVIVTDQQYQNRFGNKTFVSDYFINSDVFKNLHDQPIFDKKCYMGHLLFDRNLHNIDHISTPTLEQLYVEISKYKGVLIYDTGRAENGIDIIHHNKAKAIEALMCGRNAYCQSGIQTLNYQHLLLNFNDNVALNIDRREVIDINQKVVTKLVNHLKNL